MYGVIHDEEVLKMPITTYNCTALTGGATRALDSYSRLVLADGDRAIVAISGNKMLYFKYFSAATDAEDVAAHPYKVRPDDYAPAGVWIEQEADIAAASETKAGIMEIASNVDIDTGTDHEKAVSSSGLEHKMVSLSHMLPSVTDTKNIGSAVFRWLNGYFKNLTLGGVSRDSWPTAVAGSNGNVFFSGSVTLAGQDGLTVTHGKGDTSYLVKTLPTGTGGLGRIGDISYVKAANTVVIYNSGHGGFTADIELSNVA